MRWPAHIVNAFFGRLRIPCMMKRVPAASDHLTALFVALFVAYRAGALGQAVGIELKPGKLHLRKRRKAVDRKVLSIHGCGSRFRSEQEHRCQCALHDRDHASAR